MSNINWRDANKELPNDDCACVALIKIWNGRYLEIATGKYCHYFESWSFNGLHYQACPKVILWVYMNEIPLPPEYSISSITHI